jgi:site-specific DNA-methyltransferase (adenine-specific)
MNTRKAAFQHGLKTLSSPTPRTKRLARTAGSVAVRPDAPYRTRQMLPLDQIVRGDCVATMNGLPEGSVDLVFADPPFNIGYLYASYDDDKTVDDYLKFSESWMTAVFRVLKPGGSFFLAIGDEYAADLAVIARRKIGFNMRNWLIWHYTFGQQTKKMFAKSHTHVLYFTKGESDFTFNADAIRVASARQTTYADVRANPKGKVPDDTWFLRPQEAAPFAYFEPTSDTWNISRVCGTFKEREGWHGCQMPIAVLDRIIKAASNPGEIVLDPFNGSGTTIVSAALLGRKYIGIEQDQKYVEFATKRLAHALEARDATTAAADTTRESKILTKTDAFGRDRVKRTRAGKNTKVESI